MRDGWVQTQRSLYDETIRTWVLGDWMITQVREETAVFQSPFKLNPPLPIVPELTGIESCRNVGLGSLEPKGAPKAGF